MTQPSASAAARVTLLCVLLDAAVWIIWVVGMLAAFWYVDRTFRHAVVKVPAFTEGVLALAHWLDVYRYLCPPALFFWLAVDAVVGFVLRSREGLQNLARFWTVLMFAMPLLAVLCSFLSLWLPLLLLRNMPAR
jgi:hypothetical protein